MVMLRSLPTALPSWMSATSSSALSSALVPTAGGWVPSMIGWVLSFLLQAATATSANPAASMCSRACMGSLLYGSGFWYLEDLVGIDEVGVLDLVLVGFIDLLPLRRVAIDILGDLRQAVALLDRILLVRGARGRARLAAGRRGARAGAALYAGEIRHGLIVWL